MATQANILAANRKDAAEEFDVIIVGAGISGLGSACHLRAQCPDKSFVVLEAKDGFGGTWHTHTYPGARSDSDLYTYGYRFKPWTGAPIASADEIRKYLGDVIAENDLAETIRYSSLIRTCSWSSADQKWTVEVTRQDGGADKIYRCNFLWMCQGYYDHNNPYLPEWTGMDQFEGRLIHAQNWDAALDYAGKKVVVIGSGATAATVVPAIAKTAAKVTMLQRSPTYFFCYPNKSELADHLREIGVDDETIHHVVRLDYLHGLKTLDRRSMEEPGAVFEELKALIRQYAGDDFEFEPHFIPAYRVWQQRVAFIPDGDFFTALGGGKVAVVTDRIESFTPSGIRLESGDELEADIIIAATGFRLSVMGEIAFDVDGETVDWSQAATYRGMMFTGVPNLVWVFGYFRAAWTLRVDMLGDYVCRLLKHMDQKGVRQADVVLRPQDRDKPLRDWIEPENFNPGYLMRDMDKMPKRVGDQPEWRHTQNYWQEMEDIPAIDLDGPEFVYR